MTPDFDESARLAFTPTTAAKLADRLRLSDRYRQIAHLYLKDPLCTHTEIATQMGIPDRKVTAALASPRVRAYIRALTGAASQPDKKAPDSPVKVIASVRKCLQLLAHQAMLKEADYLNDQGRWDVAKLKQAPPGVIRKITFTDQNTMNVEFESSQRAISRMLDYYAESAGLRKPENKTLIMQGSVLQNPNVRAALAAAVREQTKEQPVVDAEPINPTPSQTP